MERGGVEPQIFKIIILPFTYKSPLGKKDISSMNQVQTSYSVYNMKYLSSHVVCKLSLWGLECFSIMRKKCKVNSLVQSFAIDCSSEWIYVHCGQIILTKFWFFFVPPPLVRKRTFIIAFWKNKSQSQISSDTSTFEFPAILSFQKMS